MAPEGPALKVVELKLPPQQEIVTRLEKLLEAARTGDIVGLVVAYEYERGGVNGSWDLGAGCRPTNLLGELTRMQVQLAQRISSAVDADDTETVR